MVLSASTFANDSQSFALGILSFQESGTWPRFLLLRAKFVWCYSQKVV